MSSIGRAATSWPTFLPMWAGGYGTLNPCPRFDYFTATTTSLGRAAEISQRREVRFGSVAQALPTFGDSSWSEIGAAMDFVAKLRDAWMAN